MNKKIKLTNSALEIAESRYFMEGENWEQCVKRVANEISSSEINRKSEIRDSFQEMIYNMDFIPAGRILRNSGRPRGSLFNCYNLPIGDSIEEIGDYLKNSLILWSEGGGVGCNFSALRPKGDSIFGKGGISSGLVSFIAAANDVSKTIESGGSRRAAAIALVDISHPEVMDFIDAKLVHERLSHFNISVIINDDFLEAVESNKDWEFKFKQKSYGKIKARKIWDKIINNMITSAEPGLVNWSNFSKNNSYYFAPITGSNPCVTGETLVAVADGRNHVSIKQLAEEGKDIPVFCLNENNKEVEVKMMRRPRITGVNEKILKVNLNDGSYIRCTENHEFTMKDGSVKKAKNLIENDRLHHMIKSKKENGYVQIKNGTGSSKVSEHRLVGEYLIGRKLKIYEVVHHKDRNRDNNSLNNLQVLNNTDHNLLHMLGNNNPMKDGWWNTATEEEKKRYKENMSRSTSGSKNGNWGGYNFEELEKVVTEFVKNEGGPVSMKEWRRYCKENKIPGESNVIYEHGFKSPDAFFKYILKKFDYDLSPIRMRGYKQYLKIKSETDLDVSFDKENGTQVKKQCENCGDYFMTSWALRERAFCSVPCSNKSVERREQQRENTKNRNKIQRDVVAGIYLELKDQLGRDPYRFEVDKICKERKVKWVLYGKHEKPNEYCFGPFKEVKNYAENEYINYIIDSIEEDGYENVYNGTVDDNHNFYIYTKTSDNEKSYNFNYINTLQCGETVLEDYGLCNLGSLVLPNFITGNVNTNWKKLENTIRLAVRFLDNVIDVNKYALKEVDISAHNSRRIGIGVLGLAEFLFAKGLKYGSVDSVKEVDRLMRFIRDIGYDASIDLAIEKGSFPKFDPVHFGKASFVRKLPVSLRMKIKEKGIRNTTLFAIAPTGTISLLTGYSSGIEPLFSKAYMRNDRVSKRIYVHPLYEDFLINNKEIPEWYVSSYDLKPEDHFEIQSVVQKYVDGSVSKTINLPKNTTYKDLSKLLLEYIYDLKGVTVYRDGSREGQVLNSLTKDEIISYLKNNGVSKTLSINDVKCASGECEI